MDDDDATVPKKEHLRRLATKTEKIEALEAANRELKSQIDSMPDVTKIERRLQKTEEARDRAVDEFETYKTEQGTRNAIVSAGVTDADDIDLVRYRYGKLPEAGRPTLEAWLAGDAKQDRHVGALLGTEAPPADGAPPASQPAGGGTPAAAPGLPPVNGGIVPGAPPAAMTIESIMAMPLSERVKPENRDAINAALAGGDGG